VAHQLIWSRRAKAEIQSIAKFIERDSHANAAHVVSKLTQATRRLSRFPFSGRMVPEWESPTFREVIVYDYRVIYKLGPKTVSIVTLLHSRRKFPKRPPRLR
jgi:toxin ParE1/3/4